MDYLVIPDLQIPFEHPKALEFCVYLKRHYRISDDACLCVGDELDNYFGSLYDHSPDATHTPGGELEHAIEKLKRWYSYFPKLRISESNHMLRWINKRVKAGIPSALMRNIQEVIQSPPGWRWQNQWIIREKHPFLLKHGMEYSGKSPYRNAPSIEAMSVVFGHLHSEAGISHMELPSKTHLWGMCVGSLIDVNAYAFKYGDKSRFKPILGAGIVCRNGGTPIWLPY